jgi:lipoyl(octanoyl) transferase
MFEALHVYDDPAAQSAAVNMAVDEALLADARVPVLRFYRWRRPSLSFGYFGRYAEVAPEEGEREIVRRWTGGGIVPHGTDVTYSVIIPAAHSFFERSSPEIYSALHEAIRRALEMNGVSATLAGNAAPKISENCFANAVRADIMSADRKIAGAAHRRTRNGLLHQGSIQQPGLPERFRNDLLQELCAGFERKTVSPAILERAVAISESKYAMEDWLKRR